MLKESIKFMFSFHVFVCVFFFYCYLFPNIFAYIFYKEHAYTVESAFMQRDSLYSIFTYVKTIKTYVFTNVVEENLP